MYLNHKPDDNIYRKEYISRINKVLNYIENNYTQKPDIEKLADIANFSKIHLNRIFSAFVGETAINYMIKTKVEKAASLLIELPEKQVSEMLKMVGIQNIKTLIRLFKTFYKMTTTQFRDDGYKQFNNNFQLNKNDKIENLTNSESNNSHIKNSKEITTKVNVCEVHELYVAYCPYSGDYNHIDKAFVKLIRWACLGGLISIPETKMISVYQDMPDISGKSKLMAMACITIPAKIKTAEDIDVMTITGGKFAVGRFEIFETEFSKAWDYMMYNWLPDSGYVCDDRLPYELYHNYPKKHDREKYIIDICIPIKAMN